MDPEDEYRTLFKVAGGWELVSLDGTLQAFDAGGQWTFTRDRNGEEKIATYDTSNRIDTIDMPGGKRESFTYDPATGKLQTITFWGVLDAASYTWTYTWVGDDLVRIDRPDGRNLHFEYDDPANPNHRPGYMTRMRLEGTDGGMRLLQAWRYDTLGNVRTVWKGTEDPDDTEVVDRYGFSFDSPALPTETTVTDPLGTETVYSIEFTDRRFRVMDIAADCPTCGFGPDTAFRYDDPNHPLSPTEATNGRGIRTQFEYEPLTGQMSRRTEAVGIAGVERETRWEYAPQIPAFPTLIERPSVEPGELRTTANVYDPVTGDLLSSTVAGFEHGLGFSLTTSFGYNASGEQTSVDPPGYSTDDVTTFHYDDPDREGQVPTRRTDPLIGDTDFEYDAFNRRTAVVGPNFKRTETEYDSLDRVTSLIECQVAQVSDTCDNALGAALQTDHIYNEFGDLAVTILPAGNAVAYEYDDAGRLVAVERKADPQPSTHGERSFFTLDSAGNRVTEERQIWDGASWLTKAQTTSSYSNRCQVDTVAQGMPGEESVTEYAYDCNGNLEKIWDANHPSAGQTNPPSTTYLYDELDRLDTVIQPWGGAGGADVTTAYRYDEQDHLELVTDAEGTITAYGYSDRDLLTIEVSEVSGMTTHTYNEHGEVVTSTDARGVLRTRTIDELDRVTRVEYAADPTLTTNYTYDDPQASNALGRLTRIARNGTDVDYAYDELGRMTRDGALAFTYDANGNRSTVGYPGGALAVYGYDFADRPVRLDVQPVTGPLQPVVIDADYLPSGPLSDLVLGNGVTETRGFDSRYHPRSIAVAGAQSRLWSYQTDAVGNITQIDETLDCASQDLALPGGVIDGIQILESCGAITADPGVTIATPAEVALRAEDHVALAPSFTVESGATLRVQTGVDLGFPTTTARGYGYQDYQYFLDLADGPWGQLSWTYDTIGNRTSETRDSATDMYVYETNTAGMGHRPVLDEIQLAGGNVRDYTFGLAGHLQLIADSVETIDLSNDNASRLSGLQNTGEAATLRYDGRSFLRRADQTPGGNFVEPTYASDGTLHSLFGTNDGGATTERRHVLYLGDRPVALLEDQLASLECTFVSTDHLGTPFVATDQAGAERWGGGFEPFGADWQAGTPADAQENGIFLRFPGQWLDDTWTRASGSTSLFYNVHRWYQPKVGIYGRVDPAGLRGDPHPFSYVGSNPMGSTDLFGLFRIKGPAPGCAIEYIMNQLPTLVSNSTIVGNLARISGCSSSDIRNGLIFGNGPEIVFDSLGPTTAGQFAPSRPNEFTVSRPATQQTCSSCSCPDALLGLGISILHEYTHQLYQRCTGPEPDAVIDAGDTFENHTYPPGVAQTASQAFLYGCP